MNLREEMILKGTMGHNEFMLNEMAAAHLVKVIKLIKDGKIEQAAKEYEAVGGVPGGVTRTVNHYKKNNDLDAATIAKFDAFINHFANIRKMAGPKKDAEGNVVKRKYVKKGAEEGKQGQRAAKKRLENKIVQQYHSAKEFIDSMKSKTDEEIRKEAKDAIDDLTIGKLYGEDKEMVEILKDFVNDGSNRAEAMKALKSLLTKGLLMIRDFGLVAEKPESGITPESKARAEKRIEIIKDKKEEKK